MMLLADVWNQRVGQRERDTCSDTGTLAARYTADFLDLDVYIEQQLGSACFLRPTPEI